MKANEEMMRCFQPYQWFIDHCDGYDDYRSNQLMWVYRPSEDGGFLVGFFYPDRTWFTESAYHGEGAKERAAARVRWLSGGNDK